VRETLQKLLEAKTLTFHTLAYAHCKKNPKALGTVQAVPWSSVDQPLTEILEGQVRELLVKEKDEDCFVGRYAGQPVAIDGVCGADYPVAVRSLPLVTVLERLVQGGDPVGAGGAEAEVAATGAGTVEAGGEVAAAFPDPVAAQRSAIELAAWKYLAQERSQTAVICLIDFTAPLPAGPQRFAFLTLVDLDERRVEAVINTRGELTVQILSNVFREKGLSKGALYPNLPEAREARFDAGEIFVHQEQATGDYWLAALECRRIKQSVAAERAGLLSVVHEVKPQAEPAMFGRMVAMAALHPTLGLEEFAGVVGVPPEQARQAWVRAFGSDKYLVSGQAAVGPSARAFHVAAGSLSIPEVRADLLSRMRQVSHNGQRYLVIPVEGPVKVRPAHRKPRELEEVTLPDLSLDELVDELMNRR
jgi:hypothetical protein